MSVTDIFSSSDLLLFFSQTLDTHSFYFHILIYFVYGVDRDILIRLNNIFLVRIGSKVSTVISALIEYSLTSHLVNISWKDWNFYQALVTPQFWLGVICWPSLLEKIKYTKFLSWQIKAKKSVFECPICKVQMSTRQALWKHKKRKHPEANKEENKNKNSLHCMDCDFRFVKYFLLYLI